MQTANVLKNFPLQDTSLQRVLFKLASGKKEMKFSSCQSQNFPTHAGGEGPALGVLTSESHSGFNPCLCLATRWRTDRMTMKKELVGSSPKAIHSLAHPDKIFWGKTQWQNQANKPGEKDQTQPQFPSKNPWWGFQWNMMTNAQLNKKKKKEGTVP